MSFFVSLSISLQKPSCNTDKQNIFIEQFYNYQIYSLFAEYSGKRVSRQCREGGKMEKERNETTSAREVREIGNEETHEWTR